MNPERSLRVESSFYLRLYNSQSVFPMVADMANEKDRESYANFIESNPGNIELYDNRLYNLSELYLRFNPRDKSFDFKNPHISKGFRQWLKENEHPHRSDKGSRLIMPNGIKDGKVFWGVYALSPENLQRQMREASAWKMMDSIDGKGSTRDVLYNDVDVVILGCSVGSMIASTLVSALCVNHITLVDPDTQDSTGDARVDDPGLDNHGRLKVLKLRDTLLRVAPYLNYKVFPEKLTDDNMVEILKGTMLDNPKRLLLVVEEVDDVKTKDLLRIKVREMYGNDKNVLIVSFADIGRARVKGVVETLSDEPFGGNALNYQANFFGEGISKFSEGPLFALSKILATYGLITKKNNEGENIKLEDLKIPIELVNALKHLLNQEIKSFEQSGLASRLAGVATGALLISFIEGFLKTKTVDIDLSSNFDSRLENQEFLEKVLKDILEFQEIIGIKLAPKV